MSVTITNPSKLHPNGHTHTNEQLHEYAERIVSAAKETFGDHQINAHVWSFRENGFEHTACKLSQYDNCNIQIPLIISARIHHNFDNLLNPHTSDTSEAMHLIGLITRSLHCRVTIGQTLNEENEQTLRTPLLSGETNKPIRLWR